MVKGSSSDENSTTNKGINVRSETSPAGVHKYPDSSTTTETSDKSVADIRNEIQNVLDLMGPSTPNITATSYIASSDADNEESLMSVNKNKSKICGRKKIGCSTSTSKNTTHIESTKTIDSLIPDIGTSSIENLIKWDDFEHSCCDHNHLHINPECLCPLDYLSNQNNIICVPPKNCEGRCSVPKSPKSTVVECKKSRLLNWLRNRSFDVLLKRSNSNPGELYKINICGQECDGSPPKRVVFDLVEGIPKRNSNTVATNTMIPAEKPEEYSNIQNEGNDKSSCRCKNLKDIVHENFSYASPRKLQKKIYYDSDGNARIDFYYFDHGNAQYFHTTDSPPVMKCEIIAEKTERYTTKFWAEFFASIHIFVSFCVSFILQFCKFILYSILRPLVVGFIQMSSDYFFKPFLTTLFNGLIQPFLIFLYNIATSIRDLCDPIAEAIGYYCRELAVLLRAIRLCTYKRNTNDENSCDCNKKYKCQC